ncbi:hypothetical protein [Polymorphum gilvum]|nr:hypothetical protein [Polymorphum gilvum]
MRIGWTAGAGIAGGAVLLAAVVLWLRFGERVYFDRMASAIAGCF